MKVIGIGVDLVERKRLEKNFQKLSIKVLSKEELNLYDDISNEDAKISFLMGRFSAKEAIIKALNGYHKFHNLSEIEVLNNPDGSPYLNLDLGNMECLISISHTKNYAVSTAIIVKL